MEYGLQWHTGTRSSSQVAYTDDLAITVKAQDDEELMCAADAALLEVKK